MLCPVDYYDVKSVKNHYRDLAKKHHSDMGNDTAAMHAINLNMPKR